MFDLWEKGDTDGARLRQRPHAGELRVRDRRRRPEPDPDQGDAAPPRPRRSARPACRWAPPRRASTSEPAEVLANLRRWRGCVPDRPRPRDRSMADPVRIVFLGGLGEIGRNCMAIEQDGDAVPAHRLRADVPRRRHARHRPRAARLHVAARERRPHRRRRRHPRPRGPRRRAALPAARAVASRSTARRSRSAWPATASRRPACSGAPSCVAVADGERRMIGPFDVEFIPVTHCVPHAHAIAVHTPQGVDPPLRRLQARPHPGRRPAHRPRPHRRDRHRPRASACCWPTRPTPRSTATRRARRSVGAVLRSLFAEQRGPADHHGQLRQPPPPHPADRRRRHRRAAASSPRSG